MRCSNTVVLDVHLLASLIDIPSVGFGASFAPYVGRSDECKLLLASAHSDCRIGR